MQEKFNQSSLLLLITLTLFFFSTSSILCRLALRDNAIDAYSFTFYRLFFGTIVLLTLLFFKQKKFNISLNNNWSSAFMLFVYAICFSYSYMNLDAGLGALILFALVQLTVIVSALFYKEKISFQKIIGIVVAFAGLVYLLYPKEHFQLSLFHVMLMIISGIAWGFYTILGKKSINALHHTADNFLKAFLFVLIAYFIFAQDIHVTGYGIILAFISGGITSALGYALWYAVLPHIQISTSGVIQLIVPVIAIFLSVLFLDEALSLTLMLSTVLILGGIFISIYKK